ncbi:MAG: hypothetical protein GQ534_02510 [Candidatus Delongbacteria bacterium]|nr:hypothetical protein [Candidatus Delongbacteria bacterium]
MNNEEILKSRIIDNSTSSDWETAKKEWTIFEISISEKPQKCLCGHYPIKKVCEIVNKKTGTVVKVGRCCLAKFLDIRNDHFQKVMRKLEDDINTTLSEKIVSLSKKTKAITTWDVLFYKNIRRKKKINDLQQKMKIEINTKILNYFTKD